MGRKNTDKIVFHQIQVLDAGAKGVSVAKAASVRGVGSIQDEFMLRFYLKLMVVKPIWSRQSRQNNVCSFYYFALDPI